MDIQFANPHLLWLLVPLLAHAFYMARRLRLLAPSRRAVALVLRTLLLALIVLALAGARLTRHSDELTVMFLVDDSQSIFQPQRQLARAYLRDQIGRMGPNDSAGMVLFGTGAALHQPPSRQPDFTESRTLVDPSRSNLADAMQLALAVFPEGTQKRIVVLSDGNQNIGDAEEVARAAAAARISVDVLPLKYENRNDVIMEKAIVENRVSLDEPFDLRIVASAREAATGMLNLLQDGRLIGQFPVELSPDRKNVFTIPTQVTDSGFHSFEAQLDVEGDQIPENNRAFSFTYAEGEPRVLLVDGDANPSQALPAVLLAEKINVDRIAPSSFPTGIGDLQAYDAVIFNNVPAGDLLPEQMKLIEASVRDLGLGFIMIGGENSFGAGGYNDSPVEKILPVSMELKNEKILPQGALVPIIHTVEIPQGQYWGEQITLAALDVLSPRDLMGVLYYSWDGGEKWLFPLQEVGDKVRLRRMIRGMQGGDMPSFDATLQMAWKHLSASTAAVKHIVVISDGDPATPNPTLVANIQAAGITISTIVINPHSPRDKDTMRELARIGGGNYYDVSSYNTLPQIFTREAATVRKSLIFEEPFIPQLQQDSAALRGIANAYPQLKGYVGTSPKDLADVPLVTDKGDPLLALWREGLGKSAAFTSDAKERWASQWLNWSDFAKFWTQTVRWVLRSPFNPNFQVQMNVEGSRGTVVIDAVDTAGNFINFLQIQGNVIAPSMNTQAVEFRQKAPGRYEAAFDVSEAGTYMLGAGVQTEDGQQGDVITGGTTVGYSPEFQASKSNDALLYRIADIARGRVLNPDMPVFAHNLPSHAGATPLWPLLAVLALPLFLADIFVRRVLVGWNEVMGGAHWLANYLRPTPKDDPNRATNELLEAKRRARAPRATSDDAQREQLLAQIRQTQTDEDLIAPTATSSKPKPTSTATPPTPMPKPKPDDSFTSELLKAREKSRHRSDKPKGP